MTFARYQDLLSVLCGLGHISQRKRLHKKREDRPYYRFTKNTNSRRASMGIVPQKAPTNVSTYALAMRYGLNYRTVRKWYQQESFEDLRSGPQEPRSKSLSGFVEAACLFFKGATKLALG